MKRIFLFAFFVSCSFALVSESFAQQRGGGRPGRDGERRGVAARGVKANPYLTAYHLRVEGKYEAAIELLTPLADLGRGYEDAQLLLGKTILESINLAENADMMPLSDDERDVFLEHEKFDEAMEWIESAANADNFSAQAFLVRLYLVNLTPEINAADAAKWAHLYLKNSRRQSLGAPIEAQADIDRLQNSMSRRNWLLGKEQARLWTPTFGEKKAIPLQGFEFGEPPMGGRRSQSGTRPQGGGGLPDGGRPR